MVYSSAFFCLLTVAMPGLVSAVALPDSSQVSSSAADDSSSVTADSTDREQDGWTNEIWNEIDYMVQMESFKLQKTVVTSGVRGDESEEDRLEYFQFISAAARPTKQNISDAISALKSALEKDEALLEQLGDDGTTGTKLDGTAKKRLFIARSHEQLGEIDSARAYYMSLLSDQYEEISHATEARDRLEVWDAEEVEGDADSSRAESK